MAEDMEGVEGGAGSDTMDPDIVITGPEDGGTPWDWFAWRVLVGMVWKKRDYGAKWGGSKKDASGQPSEARGWGRGGGGVAAVTQPRFYRGVEAVLDQGELCFKTLGRNHKWVPLSSEPSRPCQHCIQKGVPREHAPHWRVYWPY